MRWILLFTLVNFNFSVFAQSSTVRGRILEAGSLEPVSFATVYLNGTTQGSVTNDLGQYELKNVDFPAEIVVSHLSYESEVLYLKKPSDKNLVFHLRLRAVDLKKIEVEDNDRRQKNIRDFEKLFLGLDPIGYQAKLVNPEVLFFDRDYRKLSTGPFRTEDNNQPASSSVEKTFSREIPLNLKVKSNAPIIVDQPVLGYKIQVDLAHFRANYPSVRDRLPGVFWLGYYFFEPYSDVSKARQRRFEKNRLLAYYHSTQHFLRAVYEKQLGQNGYRIMEKVQDTLSNQSKLVPFDIYQYIEYSDEGEAAFVNLKDKFLDVLYYAKENGKPYDLTKEVKGNMMPSKILFTNNKCVFRANGTMPEITLRFAGDLGLKKVGAMLPDNYEPPIQKKKN